MSWDVIGVLVLKLVSTGCRPEGFGSRISSPTHGRRMRDVGVGMSHQAASSARHFLQLHQELFADFVGSLEHALDAEDAWRSMMALRILHT